MKKKYIKPSFTVEELHYRCQLLAGSDPVRNVPWWNGEGGARRFKGGWDDDWEEE